MSGILSDPRGDIQKIRELLKEYDSGFAFLKELLQNADDAGATTLRLTWVPGAPDQNHPLLAAPALVALNDGRFDEEDRVGLMRMGLGSKGVDSGKIGKFGLGTKSIFHVAEAFFFLESQANPKLRDILNPWSPHRHQEWDRVQPSDWDHIASVSRDFAEGLPNWFSLWIPLRRHQDLGNTAAIMSGDQAFPGEQTSCPKDLRAPFLNQSPMLGELLPLLRHLRKVEFLSPNTDPLNFEISRQNDHQFLISQPSSEITGYIQSYQEVGRENQWRNRKGWPQVIDTRDDGDEESSPDKAEWKHSIILTSTPAKRTPKLRVYWSVFLPVGNKPYFEVSLNKGERDLSLFLHGFFFLNSSRTQLDGLEEAFDTTGRSGPAAVCREWNRALACESGGLLPALLPRLTAWMAEGYLQPEEVASLTEALRESPLWVRFRKSLTKDGSLVYGLKNGSWDWHWIPTSETVALVPGIKTLDQLRILERLTTRSSYQTGTCFFVKLSMRRSLSTCSSNFNHECLDELRLLISDHTPNDEEAELLAKIINTTAPESCLPDSWDNVPLYAVCRQGRGNVIRKSIAELCELERSGDLFSSDPKNWAFSLGKAAGAKDAPIVSESALPAKIQSQNLTSERAATWLLDRPSVARDPKDRLPMFKHLAKGERFFSSEIQALRYLAHGQPNHKEDTQTRLFFPKDGKAKQWNLAFETVLSPLKQSWRLIDDCFGQQLNKDLGLKTEIDSCSRDTWPHLVESLGEDAVQVNFTKAGSEVIEWILVETPEDQLDCLRDLKLHQLSNTEMVAASDDGVWLDGGLEVPHSLKAEWKTLRESTRILRAAENRTIRFRQQKLFRDRILDASGVLKRAAGSERPDRFANLILHFLSLGTPSSEAIKAIKDAKWLTLESKETIAPEFILHIDGLEAILANVLTYASDKSYQSSDRLPLSIREENKGWSTLATQVLPCPQDVLELLCELLSTPPNALAIGYKISDSEGLSDWLSVVSRSEKPELYASCPLLAGLNEKEEFCKHALKLAGILGTKFQGPDASKSYLECLIDLKKTHEASDRASKQKVIRVISRYLEGARLGGHWDQLKHESSLTLLDQNGKWRSLLELAAPCAGVQKGHLLNDTLAEALGLGQSDHSVRKKEPTKNENTPKISGKDSAENLRRLLTPFRERLQEKAVAILPALLGSDHEVQALAAEILGGISPSSIKDELIPDTIMVDDQSGEALRERSDGWSFRVEMIEGSSVELESIAGPEFEAALLESSSSVFLPNPNGQFLRWSGGNQQIVCVANPSRFQDLSDRELRDVILESIRNLLWWAYVHKPSNLEEVFEKYEGLGQMSLGLARQEILRSADTQLQILGSRPSGLEEARRLSDEARARLAQADSGIGNKERLKKCGESADIKARELFRVKLDDDPEVQSSLLEGLRRRIAQQQYELDSIPFEILQNADDAASELLESSDIQKDDLPFVEKFVLHQKGNSLSFHYGGRPINSACGLTGSDAGPFKRDLVKMLLLNGSDKNTREDEQVTGRFGLGFKSVFLLSDTPRVSSGTLSFEVVGGIWPKDISEEVFHSTDGIFENYPQRTSIILDGETDAIEEANSRFLSLAPWLPIFTRRIKTIVTSAKDNSSTHRWQPEPILGSNQLRKGHIATNNGEKQHIELYDDQVQWAFQLHDGEITRLSEDLPWLWVTTPTREQSFGFALNGPFAIDPGRTRLSKQHGDVQKVNIPLFGRAASLINSEFAFLSRSIETLGKLGVTDSYRFWSSLWNVMDALPQTSEQPEGIDYLSSAIWPKEGLSGYTALIKEHAVIPNGLDLDLKILTSANLLKYQIEGWLAGSEGCQLLTDSIMENYTPFDDPSACCTKRIAEVLNGRLGIELESFSLIHLLGDTAEETIQIQPSRASLVGAALWPESLINDTINFEDVLDPVEASELSKCKSDVKFLTTKGSWEPPDKLLFSSSHSPKGDEILRAAFAPPDRILAKSYGADGARIFRAFRTRLQADAEEMAQWIKNQGASDVTNEALVYLAEGELRDEVATQLGIQWLASARVSPAFQALDAKTVDVIEMAFEVAVIHNNRNILQGGSGWKEDTSDMPMSPQAPPEIETIDSADVRNCWNPCEATNLFTISGPLGTLVSGNSSAINELTKHLRSPQTLTGKAGWYRLLCLGCTLGLPLGVRALEQVMKHWRSDLTEDFWENTIPFSLQDIENGKFSTHLDHYFEAKIHMLFRDENASGENAAFWRRVFYDFRKMHHFVFKNELPSTILDFVNYEEANGPALINFLKSGEIPIKMQDSNNPRFRGVIGQSMTAPLLFVMRELRRLNILDNRFDAACYYTNAPVRRVARKLGWLGEESKNTRNFSDLVGQSETLHKCMKDELPDLVAHLDLPLQLYAHKHPR